MEKYNRKEKILNASLEIFSSKGFKEATIRDIAKKAGVGLGTTFYYFKDKDDLFYSVIFREVEKERKNVIRRFKEIERNEKNPYKLLKKRLFNSIDTLESNELLKKIFLRDPSLVLPYFHDTFYEQYLERILKGLEGLIIDGIKKGYLKKIDPHMAALSLISILNSFMLASTDQSKYVDIGELIRFSGSLLIDGMRKGSDDSKE